MKTEGKRYISHLKGGRFILYYLLITVTTKLKSNCAGWAVCLPGVLAIAAHFVDTELAKRGRRWQKNMLLFKSANYKGVEL